MKSQFEVCGRPIKTALGSGGKLPVIFHPISLTTVRPIHRVIRLPRCGIWSSLADDLNGILGWIEQLNEVDVEGVEPMTSAVDMSAPMRKDEISDGRKRDDILKNAPKKDDGFFVVPRSVE